LFEQKFRYIGLFSGTFALDPITGSDVFGDIGIVVHELPPLAIIVRCFGDPLDVPLA
jgi:hypothetical protein